jgi:hypothetical protein
MPSVTTNDAPVATLRVGGSGGRIGVADDLGHVLDGAAHVRAAGLVGDGLEVVDVDGAPKEVVIADFGQSTVLVLRRLLAHNVSCMWKGPFCTL